MSGVCDPSGDALTFPVGAVLLTGTSIMLDESFSLRPGDVVTIDIPGIGTLTMSSASAGISTRSNHLDQENHDSAAVAGPRTGRHPTGGARPADRLIATKVYGEMGSWPNKGQLSALNIRRALDASLRRLQTDYVDLYQFHHIDQNTPWEEIWQAIEVAVQAGKILYTGSSNFAG
jgi:Aldo/keto reductase family